MCCEALQKAVWWAPAGAWRTCHMQSDQILVLSGMVYLQGGAQSLILRFWD